MSSTTIDSLLHENRRFPPTAAFVANAIAPPSIYDAAAANRLEFWANRARALHWHTPFTETLDWSGAPVARWFADGEINVAYNCLDRHVEAGLGNRVAIQFEGEPGDSRTITYRELTDEVCKAANLLTSLGVGHGDRVAIYMPLIPEAIVAMLACARVGAIHSVVFGGFAAESLRARIEDAEAKLVITADGGFRKGTVFNL
ncbi:MAG: AMP-binding protein, partial [Microbacteriaceae bacterium]|nr:AMP-binding protein [Microbacteriaceae bacterium]